ncbi:hypothetical protein Tco_0862261, partial [Tanacetum coccineum]
SRQAFEEEKRRIASQKKAAQATSTNKLSTDRPFVSTDRPPVSTDRPFVSTANTPYVSAASTSTRANAGESSFVYLGGKIPIDASTLPNVDLPIDPNMPDLEDAYDILPNYGIFNGAYDDDEDVGAVANFNNMDHIIAVSPIPTLRIHKDHLKGQILGDLTSAVQTRIMRANGADTVYMSFGAMVKDFTREDLIELYRLVMQKYGTNRPEDAYDRVLWSDLRTMFDPPLNEDAIWSLPLQQKMVSWRYYDKCEVHCLTLEACTIYMLADRKYPLSKEACQAMLKMKLLDGKMDEVCYKLLKMIEKQAGIRK